MVIFFFTDSQPIFANASTENEIYLGNVHCNGGEAVLTDCANSAEVTCSRAEFAGVICEGMSYTMFRALGGTVNNVLKVYLSWCFVTGL